ncbi:hypothetical protein [Nocardia sp. NPDC051750]
MSLVTPALIAAFLVGLLLLRVLAVTLENRSQRRVRVAVRRPRPPYRR